MEAKLAWYGPQAGPGSDVRAAKALRVDVPVLVLHGASASDPIRQQIPLALLVALVAGCMPVSILLKSRIARNNLQVRTAAYFSPHNFLRPPPAR